MSEKSKTVDECYYCDKPLGRERDGRISACKDTECPGHRTTVGPPYAEPGTPRT